MEIPESAFTEIIEYLEKHPLENNKYRKRTGEGRSQCFGIVNKRSEIPDLSRNCWHHLTSITYCWSLLENMSRFLLRGFR